MMLDLTAGDVEALLTSLEYSKRAIRDTEGTPNSVRQENLKRLDDVAAKLRDARAAAIKSGRA